MVWSYQFTPRDAYDYDGLWEFILAELPVNGVTRKVVMQLNRNGFLYVLDRVTGSIIAANPCEKVNWASHIDKETGRPVETEVAKRLRAGEQVELWPSTGAAKTGRTRHSTQRPASFMPIQFTRAGSTST